MEIQVKFCTKQERYAVPDVPYMLPGTITGDELSSLIKSLLKEANSLETDDLQFSFLISGELLCLPLQEHLEGHNISPEALLDVEYLLKHEAPVPENSLIHDDWVSGVKACNDWVLSGCYDNTLHIWNFRGNHKLTIPGHLAPVKSVAWIDAGDRTCTFVSTSHDETAMIWEWNQNTNAVECVHVCKGHTRSVDCVDVNKAERKMATGSYDNTIKIWSTDQTKFSELGDEDLNKKKFKTSDGKTKVKIPILTLSGHTEGVSGIQWTDTNDICTCSLDSTLRMWDVELGGLKSQLNGTKAFLNLSYSPLNHHIVTASADRHIRLWDIRLKGAAIVKSVYSSHEGWISSVKWSPVQEYQFTSGSYDHLLKLWDMRSTKVPLYDLSGHEDRILCVEWSANNYIISGGADCHVKIYKFQNEQIKGK